MTVRGVDVAGGGEGPDGEAYDAMTFEQLLEALEQLTERMASGQIGIEEAADLYEQAGQLHALAAARLERVQERIDRLRQAPDGG